MGPSDPTPRYGLEHVGFSVDDLDSQIAQFEAQGLEVYERSGHMAFVEGADGVRIEMIQAAREITAPVPCYTRLSPSASVCGIDRGPEMIPADIGGDGAVRP